MGPKDAAFPDHSQIAGAHGISPATVRRWANSGLLPFPSDRRGPSPILGRGGRNSSLIRSKQSSPASINGFVS